MSLKAVMTRCEALYEDLDFNAVKQWKAGAPGPPKRGTRIMLAPLVS